MDRDKSMIAKFTETMKGLADSAAEALKAEEPSQIGERAAGTMSLAAAGLVSDPLLPPVAIQPVRRKKRAAKIARSGTRKVKGKSNARPARQKSKSARSTSRPTPGQSRAPIKASRTTARIAKAAKRPTKKRRRGVRK